MEKVTKYIESGILEMYVLGSTTVEEAAEVEKMAMEYPEIKNEIDSINLALEEYAFAHAITPDPIIKPFLMATIDFSDRMEAGETPTYPSILSENSKIEDYTEWLNRPDMTLPETQQDVFAKIIGYTPEAITAIAWIHKMAPHETHDNEYEKFLIIEGTCDIIIENEIHHLVPGDYMAIPLHKEHVVKVTSLIPCKVILQRIAA